MLVRDSAAKGTTATVTIRCLGGFEILGRDGWLSGRECEPRQATHRIPDCPFPHRSDAASADRSVLARRDAESSVHRLHSLPVALARFCVSPLAVPKRSPAMAAVTRGTPRCGSESDAGRLLALEKNRDPEYCREAICLYQGEFLGGSERRLARSNAYALRGRVFGNARTPGGNRLLIGDYHEALEQAAVTGVRPCLRGIGAARDALFSRPSAVHSRRTRCSCTRTVSGQTAGGRTDP